MQPTSGSREGGLVAQKVITTLEDDLDGSEAVESVTFALDGVSYEIDLNETHADELRDIFRPYVDKARRNYNGGRRSTKRTAAAPTTKRAAASTRKAAAPAPVFHPPAMPPLGPEGRAQREEIRRRARAAGETVSERGRLSQDLIMRYGGEV